MIHICNKCQQWRPLWLWAPLNDSWKCLLTWLLTDIEITQQYPFQPLHGIVLTLVLIIGQGYVDTEHGGELVKNTEQVITAISTPARSRQKPSLYASFQLTPQLAWWHHQWVSGQSPELGSKSTERGLSIISCTYCTPWEGTNTQTKRHKWHNHQKAIFEPWQKKRQRKTNMSSAGGWNRVDESVES